MTSLQQSAFVAMRRFVIEQGGHTSAIYKQGNAYRWMAPDGRIASIGWEVGG